MARTRRDTPGTPVVPPGPSTIDLHTHTTRSDGVREPAELVAAAAAVGVRVLAITDHDNLAAYRELVAPRETALPAGLALVPGVEINALVDRRRALWEGEVHILGFGMDPADEAFEAGLAAQRTARSVRFDRMLARLRELGMSVDALVGDLGVDERQSLGRPTVARLLVRQGFARSVDDAFARILGHGGPAYVRRTGMGPAEAIAAIRAAGGLPVLAHFAEAAERESLIRELIGFGLGGLEVYYRRYDRETVASVAGVAARLGLVATGGSDYHGDGETYAEAHAHLWVPPEVAAGLGPVLASTASEVADLSMPSHD